MHTHEDLLQRFYAAFQQRDASGMVSCYHPQVQFSDPIFTHLGGERAGSMWRMLCERGKDLTLEFRDLHAGDQTGTAHWEAWYTFPTTGRKVHNIVDAEFEFRDGKIIHHHDRFDLHRWAGQALGWPGKLLGGFSFLQNKIRGMAVQGLEKYLLGQTDAR
jgi:hypothetical protein